MREIKVRGYAVEEMIDSQWIYGTGVHKTTFTDEYAKETGKKYEYFIWTEMGWVEVHGESIGECTGLSDDNGKEIYEGDIVQRNIHREGVNPHYITGEVAFIKGAFGTKIDDDLVDNLDLVHMSKYEVIGNAYEHSHLLEQHHD